jgi:hypothetical protein
MYTTIERKLALQQREAMEEGTKAPYEIQVLTGSIGTNGTVSVTVVGANGKTRAIDLGGNLGIPMTELFKVQKRGKNVRFDTFQVEAADVGA